LIISKVVFYKVRCQGYLPMAGIGAGFAFHCVAVDGGDARVGP
jgi:hypothetical protein